MRPAGLLEIHQSKRRNPARAALHKAKRFALLAPAAYVEFKRGFEKGCL
jgi:hypothetical protein